VLNGYLPGFIALREEDRAVASSQVFGMISRALGTALYGGFMGTVPGDAAREGNVRGMMRNMADGLTNM